jgi:serine/threonine protein kinase
LAEDNMSDASSHKSGRPAPADLRSAASAPGAEPGPDPSSPPDDRTIISSRTPLPGIGLARPAPLEAGSQLEGERLGQFILQKFIGGGGMGVVFRALDTTLNREVALKVLARDQSADEEALRRFRNEAQSAARLNHDNIARVHYVGEDRGVHYIVFEYIEGVNIRDLVEQNGPLPLDQAVSYTFQIAQALEHASDRAVIHRDIKPSNVLITADGRAKLVDMGLARLNQVAQTDDLTASGVTLGTFDYISPEQARDPRSADVRSDMYSLGCSFFYMLTGRPPFPEGTVLQKLLQHQGDVPPDPRTIRPDLPPDVTRVLAKLLAKNPAQRFQRPGELIAELATLADRLGVHLSSPRTAWSLPRPAPPARWRHHLPWAASIAALLLIVLAIDYFDPGSIREAPATGPVAQSASPSVVPPNAAKAAAATKGRKAPAPAPVEQAPAPNRPAAEAPAVNRGAPEAVADTDEDTTSFSGSTSPNLGSLNLEDTSGEATVGENGSAQLAPRSADSPAAAQVSSDSSTAEEASSPSANSRALAARDKLLIVTDTEQGPRTYSSMRAAVLDAKSGDTIELRFNGRKTEKPMTITNLNLTIRGGSQYQPVIVFRPEPNPVEYPPSMFTVAGGELSVSGVHWELNLPREIPADWALFETRRAERVHFERCTFTIRNASLDQTAYHAGVAFFDVKAAPGSSSMAMNPSEADETIVDIELENCIARGEATLVRDNDLQPLKLQWDNGLLATSERMLVAAGGSTQPRQVGQAQIQLRHLTASVQAGLVQTTNIQDAPYQLLTNIQCADSVLITRGRAPLVEQRGWDDVEEYMSRCQWSGERDFFDGFDTYWQILSTAPQSTPREMSFAVWRDLWAGRLKSVSNAPLAWKSPPSPTRPFHTHKPADYVLDSSVIGNPAIRAATDGADAGFVEARLPVPPADEAGDARPPRRVDESAK